MNSENRTFAVHSHILYSVIQSQAGTLQKALQEPIMNAIDAGATKVSITLGREAFQITDNGRGFSDRKQIEDWFETFGTPHADGDATYGRFRMGRGQLMSFATNVWRTGTFKMDVDIKNRGLDYTLTVNCPTVKGCTITGNFYEALSEESLNEVSQELANLVRFAQIPVILNGKPISKTPQSLKWDRESDAAYYKLTPNGNLLVYSLGVLVRSYDNYQFGCGGVIATKQALKVNFARNDILLGQCDIWKTISTELKLSNFLRICRKASFTADDRQFIARNWPHSDDQSRELPDFSNLKLFTDSTNRHHCFNDILLYPRITVANEDQARLGAKLQREGKAFVFNEASLSRFGYHGIESLLSILARRGLTLPVEIEKFEDVAMNETTRMVSLTDDQLPIEELAVLQVIRAKHDKFFKWFSRFEKTSGQRHLEAGESDVARAWTNGTSYVALSRKALQTALSKGSSGFLSLLLTLVHEYCHDSSDFESHDHDVVFYNKYHDVVQYHGGRLADLALEMDKALTTVLKKSTIVPLLERLQSTIRPMPAPVTGELQLALFN